MATMLGGLRKFETVYNVACSDRFFRTGSVHVSIGSSRQRQRELLLKRRDQSIESGLVQPALEAVDEQRSHRLSVANACGEPVRDPHAAGNQIDGESVWVRVRFISGAKYRRSRRMMQRGRVNIFLA